MKLESLYGKIATFLIGVIPLLIVSAEAVEDDCIVPLIIQQIKQGAKYCSLTDPKERQLLEIVATKGRTIGGLGFLMHCLSDVIAGAQYNGKALELGTSCDRVHRDGSYVNEFVCPEDKTKLTTVVSLVTDRTDAKTPTLNPWEMLICKSDACDDGVLQEVLTATFLDFDDIGSTGGSWTKGSFTTDAVYTPTADCFYNQFKAPITDPELYCSGNNAPECANKKLVEIYLDDADPFEVAICDDNNCIDSLGGVDGADIASAFAVGFGSTEPITPFCWRGNSNTGKNFQVRFADITAKYSDKAFDLTDYCSVAAVRKRTDICEPKPESDEWCRPLVTVGNNGGNAFPLSRCEGDCDNDNDCEGNLVCFTRDGVEEVYGCLGPGKSGDDFCSWRPSKNYLSYKKDETNLGLCEGDCDRDADCAAGLYCFRRSEFDSVPGCEGKGGKGKDYCIPEVTPSPTKMMTTAPTTKEVTISPTKQVTSAPTINQPLVNVRNRMKNACEGDCNNDKECKGDLVCFTREGAEEVPGCSGQGEEGDDYCTVRPYENYLSYKGNDKTNLGLCEGDCDRDADCATGFYCFRRSKFDSVPGCEGNGAKGKDYCIPESL